MKNASRLLPLHLALVLALPVTLLAQEAPPPDPDAPPAGMVELELARSRACVPMLARLADLDGELEPLLRRAERIRILHDAIALEDAERAAPYDPADALEAAVRDWFEADMALALRYVEGRDEALQTERLRVREEMLERLRAAMEALGDQADERIAAVEDLDAAADECEDAILVRSAVLDACGALQAVVCEEARSAEPGSRYAFVDTAEDLWDVEELRPWAAPLPLHRTAQGGVGGARTAAFARRGNLMLIVGVEPAIQPREALTAEEVSEFEENLRALGIAFDDPRFVMSPALSVRMNLSGPMAGETHYLLHFRDLSDPPADVIWTGAPTGGPLEAVFPVSGGVLSAMIAGEEVSLTAIRVLDGSDEADAVFSLGLTGVGQARAVGDLLSYMTGGGFARDFQELVPPGSGGG